MFTNFAISVAYSNVVCYLIFFFQIKVKPFYRNQNVGLRYDYFLILLDICYQEHMVLNVVFQTRFSLPLVVCNSSSKKNYQH